MKASESPIFKVLDGTKQFLIPIYQRTYSWSHKQCHQLFDDIIKVGQNPEAQTHFIGGIVYIQDWIQTLFTKVLIIDGQQRLTTIMLLLFSLAQAYKLEGNEKKYKQILQRYIFNNEEDWDLKYKLLPTQPDRWFFTKILEEWELADDVYSNIIENYNFFTEKINEYKEKLDFIFEWIWKLFIVDIALDRNYDNPQLIFESMNSTGLALSKADLIRNYLLMGLKHDEQVDLYEKYWYPIEHSFGKNISYFDRFLRDYLTLKSPAGTIPNFQEIYDSFKLYIKNEDLTSHDVLSDIHRYAKYYTKLTLFVEEKDKILQEIFTDIDTLKADVASPLIMELYEDCENGLLTKPHFIQILKLIETYVFRRAICGMPTNSMNKTFATYKKYLIKDSSDIYYESFVAKMLSLTGYTAMPKDDEFIREIKYKDVYNFRNSKYLLQKLENFEKKEKINVDNYSIEHIMPQNKNLSDDWKIELGENRKEIHEKYLHTIWNLTLTGYNSEYSDKSFQLKKTLQWKGLNDSPIWLNGMLRSIENRNEIEIEKRAQVIAENATKVWSMIILPEEVMKNYIKKEDHYATKKNYNYEDHKHLTGEMMNLFQELKSKIILLDTNVIEEVKKWYIAFKIQTNFVDVQPQKTALKLHLNANIEDIKDPKGICRDISDIGHRANGNVSCHINYDEDIDYAIFLIKQVLDMQLENGF